MAMLYYCNVMVLIVLFAAMPASAWLPNGRKWCFAASACIGVLLPMNGVDQTYPQLSLAHASDAVQSGLIYKSGKNPMPVDPNDPKKGSKKDTSFLRCLSSCKQDCQKPGEGMAKLDCVQDCQDQCCSTYEQCSFKVKISSSEI